MGACFRLEFDERFTPNQLGVAHGVQLVLSAHVNDYMDIVRYTNVDSGFFTLIDYNTGGYNSDWVAGTFVCLFHSYQRSIQSPLACTLTWASRSKSAAFAFQTLGLGASRR